MRKKTDLRIHVTPFHTQINRHEGGFTWTMFSNIRGKKHARKVIVLHFSRWWVSYLAADLRKVLREEIGELERLQELANFKDVEE